MTPSPSSSEYKTSRRSEFQSFPNAHTATSRSEGKTEIGAQTMEARGLQPDPASSVQSTFECLETAFPDRPSHHLHHPHDDGWLSRSELRPVH